MSESKLILRIAFIWYWSRASEIINNWRDGYTAAVEEIGKVHDVDVFIDEFVPTPSDGYDVIWIWGDSNCPFFNELDKFDCKKVISLTTDPQNFDNLRKCDVVFVESEPVYEAVRSQGIRAVRAFGTDTEYFCPDESIEKDLDYFYPATFSPWKLQRDIAHLGNKLTCIGTLQPDGDIDHKACVDNGVNIELGYFPVSKIRDYYRRTKQITIPAVHGSERTVLEAMSMNIPVEVTNPINQRAMSYMEEFKKSGCKTTREFIVDNYSHIKFAEKLMKGMGL